MKTLMVIACILALAVTSVVAEEAPTRKSAQINTPDGVCATISKIEGENLYLVSGKGRCKSKMIPVMVDSDVYQAKVYVDGKMWMEQGLVAAAVPDMENMQAQTRVLTDSIKLPDPEKNKEATAAGRKVGEYMLSDAYQAKVMAEIERIQNDVLPEPDLLKRYYPDGKIPKKAQSGSTLGNGERVYVFISSSMPVETLRNYAISIDRGGDPNLVMVMRGMIGGISKLIPTMKFISSFLIKDQECLERALRGGTEACESYGAEAIIDPMLFSRYEIYKVPAVVFATGVKPNDVEASEGFEGNTTVGNSKTVYGDASLDGILEVIADNTKSKTLEILVKKMRGGYYN